MNQNTTGIMVWLCVHDPADSLKVTAAFANWPHTHWEFGFTIHGSPLLDRDVIIVSGGRGAARFPLFKGLENADLVMFYFEGDNPEQFGPGQHYVTLDQLPKNLRNASAEHAVVAIELTTQNPGNGNAIQRMGRIEDHVNLGIPFLYVSPIDAIRRRTGAGIAGGHGENRLLPFQKRLVRGNTPVDKKNLVGKVVGVCPFSGPTHPPQGISHWTEQYLVVQADSYQLNTAHLTLPRIWACTHDSYRYSGSQLCELYDFMRQVMQDVEKSNVNAGRVSSAWDSHISATRTRAASGRGTRHDALRLNGESNGFSVGSIREIDGGFTNFSSPHHYSSRSQSGSLSATALGSGANVEVVLRNYCSGFSVNNPIMSSLANTVNNRGLILSRKLPKPGNLSKDTYTGTMAITDWLFTRSPASHWDIKNWARAVSKNPQNRLHVYAVEGPWSSTQVLANTTDVYGRRSRARIDLYRCNDGIFIGQPLADLIGVPFMTPLAN